eukprot:TRINITY_DN5434_c0_g1_i1.p1 TRINITY_DN5434_c0_g1~~TRINITY_DN5434_c0_g1_i1.p1  ORF type:complete len:495 (+),score=88.68 TRINITY_DN5434_c0_g1_i1:85-1485(+)
MAGSNDLDDTHPADYFVAAVAALCAIIVFIVDVYVAVHRHYPGLRARSADLLIVTSISGVVWFASSLVANNHFSRPVGTIWAWCTVWTFWCVNLFGMLLWLNCIVIRLNKLYYIFIMGQLPPRFVLVQLLVLMAPQFVFVLLVHIFSGRKLHDEDDICEIDNPVVMVLFGIVILTYFGTALFLGIRLREIREEFNEYGELIIAASLGLALGILVFCFAISDFNHLVAGRVIQTLFTIILVMYTFYVTTVFPAFKCFQGDPAYEKMFKKNMTKVLMKLFSGDPDVISLEERLAHPSWRAQFKRYADGRYARENIDFWEQITERKRAIKTISTDLLVRITQDIINRYIQSGSVAEVNLDQSTRAAILEATDLTRPDLFDEAKDHVVMMIRTDLFPDYTRSQSYVEMEKKVTKVQHEEDLLRDAGLMGSSPSAPSGRPILTAATSSRVELFTPDRSSSSQSIDVEGTQT